MQSFYGIKQITVYNIKTGRSWSWLTNQTLKPKQWRKEESRNYCRIKTEATGLMLVQWLTESEALCSLITATLFSTIPLLRSFVLTLTSLKRTKELLMTTTLKRTDPKAQRTIHWDHLLEERRHAAYNQWTTLLQARA